MKYIATTLFTILFLTVPCASAQVVETIAVSPNIADYLALDPATGDLYTTNYSQVSRVSQDGAIEVVAEGFSFLTGLGVSEHGDLYMVDSSNGKILKRDTTGTVTDFATDLARIVGIWMSSDNMGLYTQSVDGLIYYVDFDGTVTELFSGLTDQMTDIALDEAGNFYVAYFNTGQINKIAPDGTVTPLITVPSWVGYITYANGFIYATAWQNHQLLRIDVNTGESTVVAGTGISGTADGNLSTAQLNEPNGVVASVTGDTLYVTDFASNALRRIISVTSVDIEDERESPTSFMLEQNYPNPFNPSTTISYSLAADSNVKLVVTDLLGRELATLVSNIQPAGSYNVSWDAKDQPSGVYLYRLETSKGVITRRMVLLR